MHRIRWSVARAALGLLLGLGLARPAAAATCTWATITPGQSGDTVCPTGTFCATAFETNGPGRPCKADGYYGIAQCCAPPAPSSGEASVTPPPQTAVVQAGPHTCAGGVNSGDGCAVDGDCPASTCDGAGTFTFRDVDDGSNQTVIVQGDSVRFDWVTGLHDLSGGHVCSGGEADGIACDPDLGDVDCHVCLGGANGDQLCTVDGNCPSSTCDLGSTCSVTQAESWDGGEHSAPHSFTHAFAVPGTYRYLCPLHYAGPNPMWGLVSVKGPSVLIGPNAFPAGRGLADSVVIGPGAMGLSPAATGGGSLIYGGLTAVGHRALEVWAGVGDSPTAIGDQALRSATSAGGATAVGAGALQDVTTGQTDTGVGSGAGSGNVTGNNNTWVGASAEPANATDPSQATAVGEGARVGANNAVALGYNAQNSTPNSVQLGNDNVTDVNVGKHPIARNDGTGTIAATNQGGDITATQFGNGDGTPVGLYRVSYYLFDTTADAGAGAVQANITFNDGTAARTVSSAAVILTATTGFTQGTIVARVGSANSLTYSVTHTGSYGAGRYALYVDAERLP